MAVYNQLEEFKYSNKAKLHFFEPSVDQSVMSF